METLPGQLSDLTGKSVLCSRALCRAHCVIRIAWPFSTPLGPQQPQTQLSQAHWRDLGAYLNWFIPWPEEEVDLWDASPLQHCTPRALPHRWMSDIWDLLWEPWHHDIKILKKKLKNPGRILSEISFVIPAWFKKPDFSKRSLLGCKALSRSKHWVFCWLLQK